jgi:hypothetical protein
MNRRSFLALIPASFLALRFAAAEDSEVTIPVEPCPCQCSNDDGVTWFECDEAGEPYPLFPEDDDIPVPSDDEPVVIETGVIDLTPPSWDTVLVTTLPNTGTGSSLTPFPDGTRRLTGR